MPDRTDGASWELAGAVRVSRNEQGWTLVGGEEDAEGVTLRILVHHPDDDELVARRAVRIPLKVDGPDVVVGEAEVSAAE